MDSNLLIDIGIDASGDMVCLQLILIFGNAGGAGDRIEQLLRKTEVRL